MSRRVLANCLVAAILVVSLPSSGSAESLRKAYKRVEHQTKVNLDHAAKKAEAAISKAAQQTETNLKHLGSRVSRDVKNFVRWIREDDCERIGRKKGPEAERSCREEQSRQNKRYGPADGYARNYYAAIEVDCWKPRNAGRWGTTTLQAWSKTSKEDAEEVALGLFRKADGSVCSKNWNDPSLADGDWRWISE